MIPPSRTESCLVFFTAIQLLGPSADPGADYLIGSWQTARTDFPTLFYKSTGETPTLSYTGILKKVPLWALKKKKKKSPLLI